ncbi:MAG TPA: hypothetical protein K8V27_09770 [Butyricicoccus pullicaecorum]|nr:hypothetical protein [Butyricicoccus pullicaecorum]
MLEIWMVSTGGRSVHGRRAGEAAVYGREEIHFCGRGAKKSACCACSGGKQKIFLMGAETTKKIAVN